MRGPEGVIFMYFNFHVAFFLNQVDKKLKNGRDFVIRKKKIYTNPKIKKKKSLSTIIIIIYSNIYTHSTQTAHFIFFC